MVPVLEPGPVRKMWDQMRVRWKFAVALIGLAALLGGCAETLPLAQLPDFYKLPEKVLTKDEQQGKVNEMIAKGQNHQAEAAKQIEKGD
jgi:type IV pilus biogenesis protein CpaD/CtpE